MEVPVNGPPPVDYLVQRHSLPWSTVPFVILLFAKTMGQGWLLFTQLSPQQDAIDSVVGAVLDLDCTPQEVPFSGVYQLPNQDCKNSLEPLLRNSYQAQYTGEEIASWVTCSFFLDAIALLLGGGAWIAIDNWGVRAGEITLEIAIGSYAFSTLFDGFTFSRAFYQKSNLLTVQKQTREFVSFGNETQSFPSALQGLQGKVDAAVGSESSVIIPTSVAFGGVLLSALVYTVLKQCQWIEVL